MDGYLGTIVMWPMDWAPQNWAICDGAVIAIQQNTALFSLLGTKFGGNGTTTFALPDLRGRMPIGMGQGLGLPSYTLGQQGGMADTTLTQNNLPSHTHPATLSLTGLGATTTLNVSTQGGGTSTPTAGASLCTAAGGPGGADIYITPAPTANLVALGNISTAVSGSGTVTVDATGNGQPFDNHPPYLGINFIICVSGTYPSRP